MLMITAASIGTLKLADQAIREEGPFKKGDGPSKADVKEKEGLPPSYLEAVFPKMPEQRNLQPTSLPFIEAEGNKVAEDLKIHAGDFIDHNPKEVNKKITAFTKDKDLLPIFPPSVIQHKDLMYGLSEKYDIPVNVIATIMTMESAGKKDVESPAHNPLSPMAQGLFSVMPIHFEARKIDQKLWKDPQINGSVAMEVFKDFLNRSKEIHKGNSDAYIYQRALMGYNGGNAALEDNLPDEGNTNWANWESLIYGDNAMRFALTAQVAHELRTKGFSDTQVASKLSSYEIDARSYALSRFYAGFADEVGNPNTTRERLVQLNKEYIAVKARLGKAVVVDNVDYKKYLEQTTSGYQRSPALEVWASTNGGLIYDQPINWNEEEWKNLNTKKSGGIQIPRPSLPEIRIPGIETGKPKVKIQRQRDDQWKGDKKWDPEATCGSTTVAMILEAFGEDANPATVDKVFNDKGFREYSKGSIMRIVPEHGEEGGVIGWLREKKQYAVKKKSYDVQMIHDKKSSVETKTFNYQKAKELIDKGYLIIASGNINWLPDIGRGADHIFGINDIDLENRKFKVFDPWTGKESWHDDRGDDLEVFLYSYAVKPE